jgi:L-threonylcarbamoyladenylate synthase
MDWSKNPRIQWLAKQIWQGGVVAYPTEAVWGLGCDPFNNQAVNHLLQLKERPVSKGVILVAADMTQLEPYLTQLDDLQLQRLKNSWPGPVTWLVPNNGMAPEWITGNSPFVALRVTDHPVAAGLCRAFGGAIVSTSCNPQGRPPARTIHEVRRYFSGELDGISNGLTGKRPNPSEIRNLLTGEVVRPS